MTGAGVMESLKMDSPIQFDLGDGDPGQPARYANLIKESPLLPKHSEGVAIRAWDLVAN
jgi:hypothetical protein